jgi:hypothetical protein
VEQGSRRSPVGFRSLKRSYSSDKSCKHALENDTFTKRLGGMKATSTIYEPRMIRPITNSQLHLDVFTLSRYDISTLSLEGDAHGPVSSLSR